MKEPNNFDETVPGRPTAAELRAMALRQQQQIDSQHQLLAAKEQRLRFLKAQEARGAAASAEAERLRRLRERVEAQESKLRRLRALRGQVDLQKTYNVTLSNDLDSIRALFSEKEKELSLAVAKVEALTRQLEDLRRDRRGPLNLIPGNGNPQLSSSPAGRELEKLRRELMYRNQLSLQQDAKLHLQREALQQRQAELRSVDQRILELQGRLHKKKASNLLIQQNQQNGAQPVLVHQQTVVGHIRSNSQNVYPSQRVVPRGNVVAVEPYNHTPQKSAITSIPSINKNTLNGNLNAPQLIQDFALLKLQQGQSSPSSTSSLSGPESDENKIARQKHQEQHLMILKNQTNNHNSNNNNNSSSKQDVEADANDFNSKKNDPKYQTLPYNTKFSNNNNSNSNNSSSNSSSNTNGNLQSRVVSFSKGVSAAQNRLNECDSEKAGEGGAATSQQLMATVHSTPLNMINKSVAVPVSGITSATQNQRLQKPEEKPAVKPKAMHNYPSANLVIPPRKPISSVAPTSIALAPKIVSHSPKVHKVAPSVNNAIIANSSESDKSRPALPPKPNKNPPSSQSDALDTNASVHSHKPPISEPTTMESTTLSNTMSNAITTTSLMTVTTNSFLPSNADNLPIKAKPLTIKKQPLSEQPKLRSFTSNIKPPQYSSRRIEMPPSFLFPEIETVGLKDKCAEINSSTNSSIDDTDKSTTASSTASVISDEKLAPASTIITDVTRRKRGCIGENGKAKLARRVSFDPLALLLDASLEGELELVKKTAMQVTNPSAANDEGITALHNAICAGHLEIVKFLVEFGCDVNAQDSDGWTPLHCAASCNNLQMVKFLVESGACLFAATLSDHETPAEKCEEDEEGFDGCSEYLYSIQEKLGILNNGEVFAVFSYDASQSDELGFIVNDKLTVLRKGDESEREWWWARDINDREGYVPRNLLGLYPRIAPSSNTNSE